MAEGNPHGSKAMSESVVIDDVVEAPEGAEAVEATATDWKAEARKWETRAKESKKEADTNKTAAQRLAEIEEANKTAEEKANERLAAAERRAAELEARANRATVANEHGIPEAILAGPASSSAEDLAAYAETLIAFRGEQGSKRLHVPTEGKSPTNTNSRGSSWSGVLQAMDEQRA